LNKQEATEFVLRELAKGQSQAEVTRKLLEVINADYIAIERFVAQTEAYSRQRIIRRRKLPVLVLGILLISFGVLLLVVGFLNLIPLFSIIFHQQVNFRSPLPIQKDVALGFFFSGMGMVMGGSVGIYIGIQD
jgi:uncharacterized membrane protein YidH (DUF202 family)